MMKPTVPAGFVIPDPPRISLPVMATDARFPVRRIYCVGRNYAAHAVEMGHDPQKEPPFFFQKNPENLVSDGADFPYPTVTADVHHDTELVVALGGGGRDISISQAASLVFGQAIGLDMTKRDIQTALKKAGRPWEAAKAFEHSAPCSQIVPIAQTGLLEDGAIWLKVNGDLRQHGNLNQMIWKTPEIIAELSKLFELAAGDLIMTGTPAGVAKLERGDRLHAHIDRLGDLELSVT